MARRKKEPEGFHRRQIAAAAGELFRNRGIEQTSMDEIARLSGYSKATLYVYFQNKRDIAGELAMQSMELLREHLETALSPAGTTRQKYDALCRELTAYQSQYPDYFQMALGTVGFADGASGGLPVEHRIFEVGEQINERIGGMLREGMERGELSPGLDIPQTVFSFWAALSGVILMASGKQAYLEGVLKLTREQFLEQSFRLLYRSIERREK